MNAIYIFQFRAYPFSLQLLANWDSLLKEERDRSSRLAQGFDSLLKEERDRSSRLSQEFDDLNAQVHDLSSQLRDLNAGMLRLGDQLIVLTRIITRSF
jgi:hypothetical protein